MVTAAPFAIRQGTTSPSLTATLTDGNGAPIDLTSMVSVTFRMRRVVGGALVTGAAVVTSPSLGGVRYDWAAGDTAVAGTYKAEFLGTYANGKTTSIPSDPAAPYMTVIVTQGI